MYLILIKNFVLNYFSLFLSINESKMTETKHKGFKKADYGKKNSLKTIEMKANMVIKGYSSF